MTQLILTHEQTQIMKQAWEPVQICDADGKVLGQLEPNENWECIVEAKRRLASNEPRYTSAQVQAHLRALQAEWDRTGGFDKEYMFAFLERLRAEDAR
jgi:hypothetical protein